MGCVPGDTAHYYHSYLKPKIFRHRFSLNRTIASDMDGEKSVPKLFRNADFIDVTDEYYTTTDVVREVPEEFRNKKVAYICVFDNREWVPVYYGRIEKDKVVFRSMGRNIMYISATYDRGRVVTFGTPFTVNADGTVKDVEVDSINVRTCVLSGNILSWEVRTFSISACREDVSRYLTMPTSRMQLTYIYMRV